jgi:hypothetical protein
MIVREKELQQAEDNELEKAKVALKQKIQADIDLVSKKLNEEARLKRTHLALEASEKISVSMKSMIVNNFYIESVSHSRIRFLHQEYQGCISTRT